ncbi:hypothetical protein [Hydrogeniiclostridium mannosilyticum]|uniref:Uncharacterized protein n=1 Tax=Hydrogeniiclostridium mannosilyticum TaxID=2764322 RepID=A0A328UBL6_9FIRM|nr:hypothetical protein [Hydrogeniiclostridium mannosilyticum]RAQ22681.1 hypothetical protein DPQ25_12015 [Hydrogeniiclostridium mannosilyticum]
MARYAAQAKASRGTTAAYRAYKKERAGEEETLLPEPMDIFKAFGCCEPQQQKRPSVGLYSTAGAFVVLWRYPFNT